MKSFFSSVFLLVSLVVVGQINNEHLVIGEKAPLINGADQFGNTINSSDILAQQKILLVFYRGNWCPYCRKHLKTLQDNFEDLKSKGYKVLVVSPEKPEKTMETGEKINASFSIIHDVQGTIMSSYKVAFKVNKESVPSYYGYTKKKIAEYNASDSDVLPVPATYIIDTDGTISFVHYDPDYKKRFSVADILEL